MKKIPLASLAAAAVLILIIATAIAYHSLDKAPLQMKSTLSGASFAATNKAEFIAANRTKIMRSADAALRAKPIRITDYPAPKSPGGPRDYFSNAPYEWPDPAQAPAATASTSTPYVRIDGMTNPAGFVQHKLALRSLSATVAALAAGYELTGDERYAAKAADLFYAFFIDPAARMNPSLEYAQTVPGAERGRSFGIIESLPLIEAARSAEVLHGAKSFTPDLEARLKRWFQDYLDWMTLGKHGQSVAARINNQSVSYYLQVAEFSRFVGDTALLESTRMRFKSFLLAQMAPDGSFPAELDRTRPYNYSLFQFDNMSMLATILSTKKDDLWKYSLSDGRGMKKAAAYIYPYIADKSKWPYPHDVSSWDTLPGKRPGLVFAGLALRDKKLLRLWSKLPEAQGQAQATTPQNGAAVTQLILWFNMK